MVVVSGLAFGIDACAHRGAIDVGRTIAVLGCGPDVAYPAAHCSLWRQICEKGVARGVAEILRSIVCRSLPPDPQEG